MNTAERSNVVLILFDSLGMHALQSCKDKLPNLSRLQADSVTFTSAFSCSPESGPSRASLFTGLDMSAHGVWTDGVTLPKREITMPEVFQRNGYRTWLVGRRQLAGVANWTTEHARPYEFHHFDWAHGPLHRSRQNAYLAWLQEHHPTEYNAIFPKQADPDDTVIRPWQRKAMMDLPSALSFNSWVGAQFLERLSSCEATPFFGVASFVVSNSGGARVADRDCYEGLEMLALEQADEAIGYILDNLPTDAIVVLTAGHGTDASTHVPLSIRMPDQPSAKIHGLVSSMDIAPTLYDATRIVRPQRIQGQNLLTTFPRGWALTRLRHPDLPHETELRTKDWQITMIQTQGKISYQLYDLNADPNATHNLANDPDHVETLETMIDLMIDSRVALEDRTEPRIAKF